LGLSLKDAIAVQNLFTTAATTSFSPFINPAPLLKEINRQKSVISKAY
jgi:hypothetical protein